MLSTDLSLLDEAISLIRRHREKNIEDVGTRLMPHESYVMEVGRNTGLADAITIIEELARGIVREEDEQD